ncbi:MAG: acetoacetate decarboxylase family protein [Bacteroidales bacterium]
MKIDREKINFMPLIRGPLWDQKDLPRQNYESTESLMLQYETDPESISPLLPEPFKPGKKPLVTVMFTDSNGVDFMAGDGYRFALVAVAAEFDGEEGHLEGNYILVMPENKPLPILTGREWLGMPKFHTDISSIRQMGDNHLRCEVSLWGHLLFGIDAAPPFKSQNALIRKAAGAMATKAPAFGYKYIASLNGPPDADYPTIMWTDTKIEKLSLGRSGHLYFGNPTEDDIGYFKPIIDSLKTLPVVSVTQVAHSKGSMVLRIDKCGRIH